MSHWKSLVFTGDSDILRCVIRGHLHVSVCVKDARRIMRSARLQHDAGAWAISPRYAHYSCQAHAQPHRQSHCQCGLQCQNRSPIASPFFFAGAAASVTPHSLITLVRVTLHFTITPERVTLQIRSVTLQILNVTLELHV